MKTIEKRGKFEQFKSIIGNKTTNFNLSITYIHHSFSLSYYISFFMTNYNCEMLKNEKKNENIWKKREILTI